MSLTKIKHMIKDNVWFFSLRIMVAARDAESDNEAKIGKTMLLIEVTDENDNAPIIQVDIIVESNNSAGLAFFMIYVQCVLGVRF